MDDDRELDDLLDALEDLGFGPASGSPIGYATKCIDQIADALDLACATSLGYGADDLEAFDRSDIDRIRHPIDACRWLGDRGRDASNDD